MPQSQAALDHEKLREFELRMHYEGASAFAAGPSPWEHWDDTGTLGTWQRLQDTPHHTPHRHMPDRSVSQRVLGVVTRLLVLMLLVGIGGVYFSSITQPPEMVSGIRPPPITVALSRTRPDMQGADTLANKLDTLPPPAAGLQNDPLVEAVPGSTSPAFPAPVPDQLAARNDTAPADTPNAPAQAALGTEQRSVPAPAAMPPASRPAATPEQAPLQLAHAEAIDPAPVAPATTATSPVVPAPVSTDPAGAGLLPATSTEAPVALLRNQGTDDTASTSPADTMPPALAGTAKDGDWVVNLAAYRNEADARRMQARFRDKGVEAELVSITVNNRPMIRIRTTGYHSASEARDWVELLEERLGLQGVWISKR
jgi:cell division septation protein DedD